MENNTLTISSQPKSGKTAKTILKILTAYPAFWTVAILIGGLLKSQSLVIFIMYTWVVAFYIGAPTWIGLTAYLTARKKLTLKEILIHLLIAFAGIVAAYFVFNYDILGSGVKYID